MAATTPRRGISLRMLRGLLLFNDVPEHRSIWPASYSLTILIFISLLSMSYCRTCGLGVPFAFIDATFLCLFNGVIVQQNR